MHAHRRGVPNIAQFLAPSRVYSLHYAGVRGWRNWQTRQTKDLVLERGWEFESPSAHHLFPVFLPCLHHNSCC